MISELSAVILEDAKVRRGLAVLLTELLGQLLLVHETGLLGVSEGLLQSGHEVADLGDAVTEALGLLDREESEIVVLLAHVEAYVLRVLNHRRHHGHALSHDILHVEGIVLDTRAHRLELSLGEDALAGKLRIEASVGGELSRFLERLSGQLSLLQEGFVFFRHF